MNFEKMLLTDYNKTVWKLNERVLRQNSGYDMAPRSKHIKFSTATKNRRRALDGLAIGDIITLLVVVYHIS